MRVLCTRISYELRDILIQFIFTIPQCGMSLEVSLKDSSWAHEFLISMNHQWNFRKIFSFIMFYYYYYISITIIFVIIITVSSHWTKLFKQLRIGLKYVLKTITYHNLRLWQQNVYHGQYARCQLGALISYNVL